VVQIEEWSVYVGYAAVGLDCIAYRGENEEGEISFVVVEGSGRRLVFLVSVGSAIDDCVEFVTEEGLKGG